MKNATKHIEALKKIKLGKSVCYDYFSQTLDFEGESFLINEENCHHGARVYVIIFAEEYNTRSQSRLEKMVNKVLEIQERV